MASPNLQTARYPPMQNMDYRSAYPQQQPLGTPTQLQAQQQPQHQAPPTPAHPNPSSLTYNGKTYSLLVEQQPDRARMCGFGDKDRRPITPPPCVRLVVVDVSTGREIDYNEVEGNFVLIVDIYNEDGTQPANEVKHSSSSSSVSISMATLTSYPPQPDTTPSHHFVQHVPGMPPAPPQAPAGPYGHAPQYLPPMQQGGQMPSPGPTGYPPTHHPGSAAPPNGPPGRGPQGSPLPPHPQHQHQGWTQGYLPSPTPGGPAQPPAQGQFQRNLIGQLAVSAVQLLDLNDNMGYWFVLQDLSVRTEGTFRLKLTFLDISLLAATGGGMPGTPQQQGGGTSSSVNTGRVPVLATAFTEPFHVYSAKKFPGVKESTELSKSFAAQGVKIPIRKDTGGNGGAGSRGGKGIKGDDDDDD